MLENDGKKQLKSSHGLNATRKIVISFLLVILVGSFMLSLDVSNHLRPLSFVDNFFVATSATCVTGLSPVAIGVQYSMFGQIMILLMIQIGGLGFLTFLSLFLLLIQKKLTLQNKMMIQEAMNQPTMQDINNLIRNVIRYTFLIELLGMICLSFVFIPQFGILRGLYYSMFHSISAFCNAGFDLFGSHSLMLYQTHTFINVVISSLIILGGLGFVVWFDLAKKFKKELKRGDFFDVKTFIKSLNVHSKIVLSLTLLLLALGTVLFMLCEYSNVHTIGQLSFVEKIQVSYFQSVTLRTAGFATVDMVLLQPYTKLMMCLFMFIGGSPAGTAGGIKTVTFAVVCLMVYNIYHGHKEVAVFQRRIKKRTIIRSFAIVSIGFSVALISLFVLLITESKPVIDLIFEAFSAFGTVGLSAGVTSFLSPIGKIVVIILMFIGRIGSVTLLISFANKSHRNGGKSDVRYLDEDILLG